MQVTNKQLRNQLRNIHIVASLVLGTFIYSPWRANPQFLMVISLGIIPILTVTGIWMWKGQQIQALLKRSRHSSPSN